MASPGAAGEGADGKRIVGGGKLGGGAEGSDTSTLVTMALVVGAETMLMAAAAPLPPEVRMPCAASGVGIAAASDVAID